VLFRSHVAPSLASASQVDSLSGAPQEKPITLHTKMLLDT